MAKTESKKRDFLFVKSEYKLIKINLHDVLFLSGLRDYTQIYFKGKASPLTTLQNLKEFETKFNHEQFLRVHRSYIVAVAQIDSISRNEITIGHHNIPIGNAYRPTVNNMIEKNS
jgi:DNA-binding LytR/AlgR family response regulator